MALPHAEENISDDDFYFGQLTLKEIKKHILWDKTRHNIPCSEKSPEQDSYKHFKLIETHSEPNLIHSRDIPGLPSKCSNSDKRNSEESFIKLENMVEEHYKSDKAECKVELNNTLDVIDYILNHGPPEDKDNDNNRGIKIEDESCLSNKNELQNIGDKIEEQLAKSTHCPSKVENVVENMCRYNYLSPTKTANRDLQNNAFATPSSEKRLKSKIKLFKTPGPPSSQKKPSASSLKIAPSKSKAYEHICSPVASYIKKTPQVPLMKDVHPKKPLPSSIPKYLWNSTQKKTCATANMNLPSIAYRSAKKTQVIDISDEEKLPNSQWIKKITSTLPKPVVMKHDHREVNMTRKPLIPQQEDSFADLSYHRADLSICTQKSAFNLKKHL